MSTISVIVPVYKVERYLERCIKSILSQSYKDLEIILVDDGSPDNCPSICDRYAEIDNRIVVIHKENGGLSSARNAGLDYEFKGDYISFIDSDDWIEEDTYELCAQLLQRYEASAVQFGIHLIYSQNKPIKQKKEKIEIYSGKEVLQYYMRRSTEDSGEYSICIGVYHKDLFEGLRFREGRVNEDIDFKYLLMARCDRLVVTNQIKYNYFQTDDTISTGGLRQRDFQLREAGNLIAELSSKEEYGDIAFLGRVKQARTAFSLLSKIAFYGIADNSIEKKITVNELTKEHRANLRLLIKAPLPISRKILSVLFAISFDLTEAIIHLFKKL